MRHLFGAMGALCMSVMTINLAAGDWVHWRGPNQNGYSAETNLPSTWSKDGENLLWDAPYGSRAAPMVMNGRVYMISPSGTGETLQESVVCLDLVTGKKIWEHRFNVFLTDIVEHRLGWAQVTGDPETGYVYAHGVQGLLWCFDSDGKVIWNRSLTEEFGRISGYGGRTHSPILEGDMLIMGSSTSGWGAHGRGLHRIAGMNKRTGEILWWYTSPGRMLDTTYSVPVVATVNGMRMLIAGFADGTVQGLKVNTGEPVWSFTLSKRGINTSVVYYEGKVFASHSEENFNSNVMGSIIAIDATKTGDITETGAIWRHDGIGFGGSSPALVGDLLYVADNSGNLHCYNANTGEEFWEFNFGNASKGSPTYGDGKIYIGEMGGKYHILEVSKAGAKRLNEVPFNKEDGSPIELFSSPAIADGRVLLVTKEHTYAIGTSPKKPSKAKVVKPWKPDSFGAPAHLQIVPAETWVDQGGSQQYKARVFDAKGNFLEEVKPSWSVKGVQADIDAKGMLKAKGSKHSQAGSVDATYKNLKASARLRVIPSLPFEENFDDLAEGRPPAGWISAPPKSQVTAMDGGKVLKKMADRMHPAFARMRNYMMPPLKPGYTVQSDLYGQSKKRRFWPDMGLINSRYMLRMMGTTRKPVVRLVTWDPMPRLQKDVEFDWKPDTWYTAKLSYHIEDGKGVVRGKVWAKGEAEPADWTIEMIDPIPNSGGSPGLYGYSTAISETSPGTEVYYDNVKITRNK